MNISRKYLYLANWKKQGLDKLPQTPIEIYLDIIRKNIDSRDPLEKYLDTIKKDIHELFISPQAAYAEIYQRRRRLYYMIQGYENEQVRKQFERDEITRVEAEKKLAQRILPQSRGGKAILNMEAEKAIPKIYIELRKLIREVRKKVEVPLKKTDNYEEEIEDIEPERIEAELPWINDLLKKDEYLMLVKVPSIKDCALNILHKRLKSLIILPIKKRTLYDLCRSF